MSTIPVQPPRCVLLDCVRTATEAPSLHNSQPWRFRPRGAMVDVYADPGRRLRVLDPSGREQLISVGAAVFTLRLAIRRAGYRSDVNIFPEPAEPDLAARVTLAHAAAPSTAVRALAAAIGRRHTNRWPFAETPVAADILDALRAAARRERAVLAVAHPAGREAILRLARSADRWLRDRPGRREELARWTAGGTRHDGVPRWAAGLRDENDAIPTRDFAESSSEPRRSAPFEPYPTILVLATAGDRWPDWIRAGQALQRVLLTATWKGLATTPISQPLEVPWARRMLLDPATGLSVQMVLRVGYGGKTDATRRRPIAEVLLPGPHTSAMVPAG
ncbi:Acg family FMN-binding oxidoreductase [Actinoplanes sp. NPDC049118]|uniref:Acg family FMN-binding oxidoreductase n=1 Tax=Actinoplanes sp. NPDC049118 TaxID=3155769 RepID=UPI0033DA2DCC